MNHTFTCLLSSANLYRCLLLPATQVKVEFLNLSLQRSTIADDLAPNRHRWLIVDEAEAVAVVEEEAVEDYQTAGVGPAILHNLLDTRLSANTTIGARDDSSAQRSQSTINDSADGEMNAHITERFRGRPRRENGNNSSTNGESASLLTLNPHVARYVSEQEKIPQDAEEGDWLSLPEIPPAAEILIPEGESVSLLRNKIDQPWTKKERYLKAHYKLLREDTVSPLREAVAKFKKDPRRMDDNDLRIYEQVRVVGLTFTYKGIATRIRFSLRSEKKVSWAATKRLTVGTLVALTPTQDAFATQCILATVLARPLINLEGDAPEIDILFDDHDCQEVDSQKTYTMVEASQGYFEAYRHTMKALQKQSKEK